MAGRATKFTQQQPLHRLSAEADALSTAFFRNGPGTRSEIRDKYPQYRAILVTPEKRETLRTSVAINMPESKWRRVDEKA